MNSQLKAGGIARLTHWGLLRARGADAASFLQGQLTNDVLSMPDVQARLAGFCSAKGRLQSSFVMWRTADGGDVLLACSASVLAATVKRLSMFVLRAKCRLDDASDELWLHGVTGDAAQPLLEGLAVWEKREGGAGTTVIRLPDAAGLMRGMCLAAPGHPVTGVESPTLDLDVWRWLEVQSGVPLIEAATVDQFVPQMVNFEVVGGVDFKKGCYPGQEVVARSQYRGTIKRRMYLFDVDAQAAAGDEIYDDADPSQPAGMVVNAAPKPLGEGFSALVEIKRSAADSIALRLGGMARTRLRRGDLPYEEALTGS